MDLDINKLKVGYTIKDADKLYKKILKWSKKKEINDRLMKAENDFDYVELIGECALYLDFDLENEKEILIIYFSLKKIRKEIEEKS
jgi:hypothetical protein